jgi:hypothetical protein
MTLTIEGVFLFGADEGTLFSTIEQSPGLFSQICPARHCTANLEIRPTVPKICYRLGAPTNFDRSAVLFALFISHCERSQTNRFKSPNNIYKNKQAEKICLLIFGADEGT